MNYENNSMSDYLVFPWTRGGGRRHMKKNRSRQERSPAWTPEAYRPRRASVLVLCGGGGGVPTCPVLGGYLLSYPGGLTPCSVWDTPFRLQAWLRYQAGYRPPWVKTTKYMLFFSACSGNTAQSFTMVILWENFFSFSSVWKKLLLASTTWWYTIIFDSKEIRPTWRY